MAELGKGILATRPDDLSLIFSAYTMEGESQLLQVVLQSLHVLIDGQMDVILGGGVGGGKERERKGGRGKRERLIEPRGREALCEGLCSVI